MEDVARVRPAKAPTRAAVASCCFVRRWVLDFVWSLTLSVERRFLVLLFSFDVKIGEGRNDEKEEEDGEEEGKDVRMCIAATS